MGWGACGVCSKRILFAAGRALQLCRALFSESAERLVKQESKSEFGRYSVLVLVDKLVLDYVVGEFSIRLHSHLLQYPRPVGADSAIAQREQGGNLTHRFS